MEKGREPRRHIASAAAILGRQPFSKQDQHEQQTGGQSWQDKRKELLDEIRALNGNQDPGYSGDH